MKKINLTKNNIENIMAMITCSLPSRMKPQWREIYTKGEEFFVWMGYKLSEEELRSSENEFKKHTAKDWKLFGNKKNGVITLTEYWLDDKFTSYGFNAPDQWYEAFRQSMYPLTNWDTEGQYQLHETILNFLKHVKEETIVSKKMRKKILEKIKFFFLWKEGFSPEGIDRIFGEIETVIAFPALESYYGACGGMKFDFIGVDVLKVSFYKK